MRRRNKVSDEEIFLTLGAILFLGPIAITILVLLVASCISFVQHFFGWIGIHQ